MLICRKRCAVSNHKQAQAYTHIGPYAQHTHTRMHIHWCTFIGTPGYTAPEILTNKPYGKAVDMWSLGVILYSILCAFPPFYHDNTAKLYRMIRKGEYSFPDPYWTEISESAKDLIRGLLTVNAKKRMTAAEVLRHPWIVGNNLSTRSLGDNYADRVSIMHARNKFRRVIRKVLAINRFARVLKMIQQLEDASDGPSTNFVDLTALRGIQAADADDSDRDEEDGEEASAGKLANRRLSNQFRNYNRYTYAKNTSAKKKSPTTSHRNMSYSASSSPSPSSSSSSSSSLSSSSSSQRSSVPSMRRRGSRSSLNVASPSASSSSSSSPQSIGKKSKRTRKSLDANLKQIQE